jgi:hypothetical protein
MACSADAGALAGVAFGCAKAGTASMQPKTTVSFEAMGFIGESFLVVGSKASKKLMAP